jgi:hypothetical protein
MRREEGLKADAAGAEWTRIGWRSLSRRCRPRLQEAYRAIGQISVLALAGCRPDTTPGVEWTPTPRRADTPGCPVDTPRRKYVLKDTGKEYSHAREISD